MYTIICEHTGYQFSVDDYTLALWLVESDAGLVMVHQ